VFYKLLGFAVWKGLKTLLSLKYPNLRRNALAAGVAVAVVALAAGQARRDG
jgi:hypothetical protein